MQNRMVSTFAAPPHLPGQAENSRAARLPREQPVHLIFLSCNGKAGSKGEADQVRVRITSGISIPLNLASPRGGICGRVWYIHPCPLLFPSMMVQYYLFCCWRFYSVENNLSKPLAMVDFPSRSSCLGHRQPALISSTEPGVGF